MGTKPQGDQGVGEKPTQNTHFVRTLRFLMTRRGMGTDQLVRELGQVGLYFESTDVLAWKRGCGCPQWDQLLPALQDVFGHPAVDWLSSIGTDGLPVLDCRPLWGVNLQNQEWGLRLRQALAEHDVSRRELANWLRSVGFEVGRSTVQDWTNGSVPLDGLAILPWISKILRVPLVDLIPDGRGVGALATSGSGGVLESGGPLEDTATGSGSDTEEPNPPDPTPDPEKGGYR